MGDRSFRLRGGWETIRTLVWLGREEKRDAEHLYSRDGEPLDHRGEACQTVFAPLRVGQIWDRESAVRRCERGARDSEAQREAASSVFGARLVDGPLRARHADGERRKWP